MTLVSAERVALRGTLSWSIHCPRTRIRRYSTQCAVAKSPAHGNQLLLDIILEFLRVPRTDLLMRYGALRKASRHGMLPCDISDAPKGPLELDLMKALAWSVNISLHSFSCRFPQMAPTVGGLIPNSKLVTL
ncbi:hypothetical protein BRADI_3g17515v3 [Brachypodium distachyon]|uniref:Uncharacterized protein n=1 Tax=Brachypodium distachyon TaxID=15368 RepID=A0A0Q3F6Y5_BRADI|nr:hypothetical protein BRADI_3g17515v3 [Brachypodium distachyon]PNT66837.1 hypothetical protein BRADI_3g17515v3 [Brachypodium distachyon]PNT66838.1 hypothetical protein BRADI_3g17515v3 [Brachypodium distachyon]